MRDENFGAFYCFVVEIFIVILVCPILRKYFLKIDFIDTIRGGIELNEVCRRISIRENTILIIHNRSVDN